MAHETYRCLCLISILLMPASCFLRDSGTNEEPAVEDGPNRKVYLDALWFRVHAEDCPALILKEEKQTMTLEEADKAGARIGESGQSGRERCCLLDYERKYPPKTFTDDTILCGDDRKDRYKHVPGCHRYWPDRTHTCRPMIEWLANGYSVCPHCIERGPSLATISAEEWQKLPPPYNFTGPEGWEPTPFPPDQLPSKRELDIFIEETLSGDIAIQELQFTDPVATLENFMVMRFFFPVTRWLHLYQAYRSTGDKRILEQMRGSARHYNNLSKNYLSVARMKASDPEGLAYMYTMAASAWITLQLARKYPSTISASEIAEAEDFLKTTISVLKPTCEGNDNLDAEMGIPQKLADDFRYRAPNRAANGIGTISMIAAALGDLQTLKNTKAYQPTIVRYRKVVQEFIEYFIGQGHMCTKFNGQPHFYYAYAYREGDYKSIVDGCKIYHRPEDTGHYSHTMQGLMIMYQTTPELGIDDDFMTAVANSIYHNATTEVEKKGKTGLSGHVECPTQTRVSPYSTIDGDKRYEPARDRFYMLQAFRDDMIDGLCATLNEDQKAARNSEYEKRLATLHAQYMKALRRDRSLIHLGEQM